MLQASGILKENTMDVEPEFEAKLRTLLDACHRNLPSVDEDLIRRAFRLSYWAHRNDHRASGELYITHPLEVAMIVAEDIRTQDGAVVIAKGQEVTRSMSERIKNFSRTRRIVEPVAVRRH